MAKRFRSLYLLVTLSLLGSFVVPPVGAQGNFSVEVDRHFPKPGSDSDYRTRPVVIDALAMGVTKMSLDSLPESMTVEVTLSYHLQAVVTKIARGGRKSQFSVTVWHWNDPSSWDPEDGGPTKSCGFSYHY